MGHSGKVYYGVLSHNSPIIKTLEINSLKFSQDSRSRIVVNQNDKNNVDISKSNFPSK